MKKAKFFRFIWRFNALGIAVGVVLAILFFSLALATMIFDARRERLVSHIVRIDKEQYKKITFRFGSPHKVEGSDIISIPLYAEQKYAQSYYYKSSTGNIVNYSFFNYRSQDTRWLFDHSDFLIIDTRSVSDYADKEKRSVKAYIYSIIKDDTNKDERLTSSDNITIAISRPDGRSYKELFSGVRTLIGVEHVKDNEAIIVFTDDDGSYIASISMDNFALSYKKAIPGFKQEVSLK